MKTDDRLASGVPHLLWVYGESLNRKLDAATWLETSNHLCDLGWRVTLAAAAPGSHRRIGQVEVRYFPKPPVYLLRHIVFHLTLAWYLMHYWSDVDVILFHPASAFWLLPLFIFTSLTGSRRPWFVMDTRDLNPPGGTLKNRVRVQFYRLMHSLARHWTDGQTAITQRMADLVKIPPQKLWGVWPSGVNPQEFAPAQRRRRWPADGEPIHLVYVGVLLPERNLLPLSEAVEAANAEGMSFTLSLVGGGAERAKLEDFARGTGERVRVVPPVPHDEVVDWLAKAHVGVTSMFDADQAIFQASSPIKLFEYLAAGLPILAPHLACYGDVIGDGEFAIWVDYPDAAGILASLRQVWQKRDTLEGMGALAASAAQAWTWAASAEKLKRALERGARAHAQ